MYKTGMRLETVGLVMPPEFPAAEYGRVHSLANPAMAGNAPLLEEFFGAWKAIAYRYFGFSEHEQWFTASLKRFGSSPESDERYRQERDLFGMFSNGLSMLESTLYGLFVIGAHLAPTAFSFIDKKGRRKIIWPETVHAAFGDAFPSDRITAKIYGMLKAPEYRDWRDTRNILMHRSAPGRTFFEPRTQADQWKLGGRDLTETMGPELRAALSGLINPLMQAAAEFAEAHLSHSCPPSVAPGPAP